MEHGEAVNRLTRFVDAVWAQEPPDIRRLRETRLPRPAGGAGPCSPT